MIGVGVFIIIVLFLLFEYSNMNQLLLKISDPEKESIKMIASRALLRVISSIDTRSYVT